MKCFMTNQDCTFEKAIQEQLHKEDKRSLFVVSPFGYPYDDMYTKIIKPLAEAAKIEAQRADRAFQLGFVMCTKICKLIQEADYIIADVTVDNPNVYYELGLAWGFGKKVALLRDTDVPTARGFKEIFQQDQQKVITYHDLLDLLPLEEPPTEDKVARIRELLEEKSIDVEKQHNIEEKRAQGAYIPRKSIRFCYQDGLSDSKFYERAIQDALNGLSSTKPWDLHPLAIGGSSLSEQLPKELSTSKILMVDVTHYDSQPVSSIYFTLGLSHAMGRETIPITNKARYSSISPFDVRGLWQVYFDKLEELSQELLGILQVIDKNYESEINEYPLRFIWDKVLRRLAHLSVFTCARGAQPDNDRVGGRTNVDKWDYTSVAELALFLAQKYKQADMVIKAPEEKVTDGLKSQANKNALTQKVTKTLKQAPSSIMIIGSPDVSDYAEVVLAKIYSILAYNREECKHPGSTDEHKCWNCSEDHPESVGRRGYLFYKKTTAKTHTRELSAFFRNPPVDEKDCVLWYGEPYECDLNKQGQGASEGVVYGVLTLVKDTPSLFAPDNANRWIILLSGFSGVATYGLAQLLISLDVKTEKGMSSLEEGMSLQEALNSNNIDLELNGVQVLLKVQYISTANTESRDPREPTKFAICDVRPVFCDVRQPANS